MKSKKIRLTVTVDQSIVKAGKAAVASGSADSLSAWVSNALADRAANERRMAALGKLLADYEAEHGAITDEELAAQQQTDRRNAIVIRGPKRPRKRFAHADRRTKAA